jgi:hypothetical protein
VLRGSFLVRYNCQCFQRFSRSPGESALHKRSKNRGIKVRSQAQRHRDLRARCAAQLPNLWDAGEIEFEYGRPLDRLDPEDLRDIVSLAAFVTKTANGGVLSKLTVPEVVGVRVLDWCLREVKKHSTEIDGQRKTKLEEIEKELDERREKAIKHPNHRPPATWVEEMWHDRAVVEFRHRMRELRRHGIPYADAREQAAAEIAPDYNWSPSTLLTRVSSPGRFKRRK